MASVGTLPILPEFVPGNRLIFEQEFRGTSFYELQRDTSFYVNWRSISWEVSKVRTLRKAVADDRLFDFDFSGQPEMRAGDTVATATVTQEDADPASIGGNPVDDLDIGLAVGSGGLAQARISAGQHSVKYLLRCEVVTTAGHTIVGYGRLEVKDELT